MLLLVSKSLNHVSKLRLVIPIYKLHTYRRGEFKSKEFMEFCDKVKIQCQIYNSYNTSTKQCCNWNNEYNLNIIWIDKNKSIMLKSNTPNHLWANAFNTTLLKNETPTKFNPKVEGLQIKV